jgi:NAD(P)H-hydrate epimerase
MPTALVSLTAPKPLVKHFNGRHFVGGRYVQSQIKLEFHGAAHHPPSFVSPSIAKKYDFEVPEYPGVDQIVELPTSTGRL